MKKYLDFFLIIMLLESVFSISNAATFSPAEKREMTLNEAIDLALHQNPNMKLSVRNYEAQFASQGVIQSGRYPQIQSNFTYSRATANVDPYQSGNASSPDYSASLSFTQLLYDFGQLSYEIRSAEKISESADTDRRTAATGLIMSVKQAYYGLLQSIQIEKVDEETVRQMEKHLEQAEGFFRVGSKPKFDVTKAQVDLTNAKLILIKGKNDVEVAKVILNNAMGLPVDSNIEPIDRLTYKKEETTLEEAEKMALEKRPELASLRLKKQSSIFQLEFSRHQYYPVLSANGSYVFRNSDFPLVQNWNVAATLTLPLFNGFQTTRQVDQAGANVEIYSAQEEIQIQNILLDVRQAYLNLIAAGEQIATSELVVRQASENLDLAEGRYKAGIGTAIETTDAEVSLSNAKTTAVQALYNYNVAESQLQKAIGADTR